MTMIGLAAANIAFAVIGAAVLVVARVAPSTGSLRQRLALAPLTGMATIGILGAISEPLYLGITLPVLILLLATSIGLLVVRLNIKRDPLPPQPRWSPIDRMVGGAACVGLAAVGMSAALAFWIKPILEYDSWAMWALKAHALAAFRWADPNVFSSEAYRPLHLEYPLVLPVIHAIGIRAAGTYEGRLVILQCLFIGGAGLLSLWGLLHDRVRPAVLLPCLLAIAIVPGMFGQLATAYADVPLALFVVVAVAASARWLVDPDPCWLVVATLFLIAAALTKNEGLLFSAAVYTSLLLAAVGRRRILVILSGLALGIAILPWRIDVLRHRTGSGTDYDLSSPLGTGDAAEGFHRGIEALHRLLGYALDPERFGFLLPLAVTAAVIALLLGIYRLGVFLACFLVVSFAGLTWIYMISPLELDGYLTASGDRVVTSVVLGGAAIATLVYGETVPARNQSGSDRRDGVESG